MVTVLGLLQMTVVTTRRSVLVVAQLVCAVGSVNVKRVPWPVVKCDSSYQGV